MQSDAWAQNVQVQWGDGTSESLASLKKRMRPNADATPNARVKSSKAKAQDEL